MICNAAMTRHEKATKYKEAMTTSRRATLGVNDIIDMD
jgi:hypothetical protein